MPLLITFVCDKAHPHVDGGLDGVKCDNSQSSANFDHDSETCGDLFRAARSAGWHIAAPHGAGKPERVLCPAHRAALGLDTGETLYNRDGEIVLPFTLPTKLRGKAVAGDDDTTEETKDP